MENMYLIMKYEELSDQYECDAKRIPIALTDDWKNYYNSHKNDLDFFEVYLWDGHQFSLIKAYDCPMEYGMALYYWTAKEWNSPEELPTPHIIEKWVGKYNRVTIPIEVSTRIYLEPTYNYGGVEEKADDNLHNQGYISWFDKDGNYYVYGEYRDNHFSSGI